MSTSLLRRWKVLVAGPVVAIPLALLVGGLLLEESPSSPGHVAKSKGDYYTPVERSASAGPQRGQGASAPVAPRAEAGGGPVTAEKVLVAKADDAKQGLGDRVKAIQELEQRSGSSVLLARLANLDASKDKSAVTLRPVLLASLVRQHDDPPARRRILAAIGPEAPLAERLLVISAMGGATKPAWLVPHLTRLEQEDPEPAVSQKASQVLQQLTARGALVQR